MILKLKPSDMLDEIARQGAKDAYRSASTEGC